MNTNNFCWTIFDLSRSCEICAKHTEKWFLSFYFCFFFQNIYSNLNFLIFYMKLITQVILQITVYLYLSKSLVSLKLRKINVPLKKNLTIAWCEKDPQQRIVRFFIVLHEIKNFEYSEVMQIISHWKELYPQNWGIRCQNWPLNGFFVFYLKYVRWIFLISRMRLRTLNTQESFCLRDIGASEAELRSKRTLATSLKISRGS